MSLEVKLFLVFLAFIAILVGVIRVVVRERERVRRAEQSGAVLDASSDNVVLLVLFGAVMMGALLALVVAWLVFF
jgi:hypothetical protein